MLNVYHHRELLLMHTISSIKSRYKQSLLGPAWVASFQEAAVTDLVERTVAAASSAAIKTVFVSGGVACNSLLRERFDKAGKEHGFNVFFPSLRLSTDNAAMIAAAGYYKLSRGLRDDASLNAHASFPLGTPPA